MASIWRRWRLPILAGGLHETWTQKGRTELENKRDGKGVVNTVRGLAYISAAAHVFVWN